MNIKKYEKLLEISLRCWKTFAPTRRILTIFDKANIRAVVCSLGIFITLLAQGRRWCSLLSRQIVQEIHEDCADIDLSRS